MSIRSAFGVPEASSAVILNSTQVLHANETDEPMATSVSILGLPPKRERKPLTKNF